MRSSKIKKEKGLPGEINLDLKEEKKYDNLLEDDVNVELDEMEEAVMG